MFLSNQTKETNVSNVQASSENLVQNVQHVTIQSASPQISTCAIQTEQSPLLPTIYVFYGELKKISFNYHQLPS